MLQTVEAIVKGGVLSPLEPIPLNENDHFLLVRLGSAGTAASLDDIVKLRRTGVVRWYDDYLAQVAASAPATTSLTEAEIVKLVHESR